MAPDALNAPGRNLAFVQALAATLLAAAVLDLGPREARDAARFTAERLSGAPAFTRLGMGAIGAVLDCHVRIAERVPFADLDPERQAVWVGRWSARPIPGVGDYLDAVRGLALTWLYEARAA
jgi:hypothetical protein